MIHVIKKINEISQCIKKQSMGKHTFNNMQNNHSNKKETTVAEETALKQLLRSG